MTPLAPLDSAIDDLTAALTPSARKALGTRVAIDLQKSNAARMRANVEPEGGEMAPRKAKPAGKPRRAGLRARVAKRQSIRARMFQKAAGPRYLRKQATSGEAQVGFVGAMARIMRVHQLGLRDTVTRDPKSPEVTYDARRVIGIAGVDRARMLDTIADHLER